MNQLIEYAVPEWVKMVFLIAIPTPIILVSLLVKSAFPPSDSKRMLQPIVLFFSAYVLYILVLDYVDSFSTVFFPPKILLLTTFPFAFFLFFYVGKTNQYITFIAHVALDKLVRVHIFRLIGGFFIILACYDALPKWFALIAGIGDVLTAVSSLWVSKLVKSGCSDFKKITWWWNTFGLVDILFTAVSANVLTKLSIDRGIMGVDTLAMFPFYLIPALAPPIIVFLHYSTYLKLKK